MVIPDFDTIDFMSSYAQDKFSAHMVNPLCPNTMLDTAPLFPDYGKTLIRSDSLRHYSRHSRLTDQTDIQWSGHQRLILTEMCQDVLHGFANAMKPLAPFFASHTVRIVVSVIHSPEYKMLTCSGKPYMPHPLNEKHWLRHSPDSKRWPEDLTKFTLQTAYTLSPQHSSQEIPYDH